MTTFAQAGVTAGLVLWSLCGCAPTASAPVTETAPSVTLPPLPQPQDCVAVVPGTALQGLLDGARDGSAYCLAPGDYAGPLLVSARVTLWGPRDARIVSSGTGTTVELAAKGAALLGVTVDGSGGRFDKLDAAVHVTADDVWVQDVHVVNATFGLLVEKANRARIVGNLVQGPDAGPLGLRGDGIRLWETRRSKVLGNRMIGCRDMVVWYSSNNVIADNTVKRSRYGTHFMYSHNNAVRRNRYVDNVVGMFVMYSQNIRIEENLFARSAGAGGMGLGIKESGNLDVDGNAFVANNAGIYMDTTPLQKDHHNTFSNNDIYFSEVGVLLHGSEKRNAFIHNTLANNHVQVEVEGGGTALEIEWRENSFDDYAGYDLDGDGFGDIPYELRRLSAQLKSTYPQLGFFRGTVALDFLDAISSFFPLVEPKTTLIDDRPVMDPTTRRRGDAG